MGLRFTGNVPLHTCVKFVFCKFKSWKYYCNWILGHPLVIKMNMLYILKVNDTYAKNSLSFVNRCLLLDAPPAFADYVNDPEVNYGLRSKRLEVWRFTNEYGMFHVAVQCADPWNNIPDTLSCFIVNHASKSMSIKLILKHALTLGYIARISSWLNNIL